MINKLIISSLDDTLIKTENELKIDVLLALATTYPNFVQNEKVTTKIVCDKYQTTATLPDKFFKPISKIVKKHE